MENSQAYLESLRQEVDSLRQQLTDTKERLAETEETLQAIRSGEVDAVVVSTSQGAQVFTLQGADYVYQCLVEQMGEGAATVSKEGLILYCNKQLAGLLNRPLQNLIGSQLENFISPQDRKAFGLMLQQSQQEATLTIELSLIGAVETIDIDRRKIALDVDVDRRKIAKNKEIPVKVSLKQFNLDQLVINSIVVTDITESKVREAEKLNQILKRAIATVTSYRFYPNRTWVFYYWSDGCEVLLGYTAKELMADQHLWASLVDPEDLETLIDQTLTACQQNKSSNNLEYRFYDKNGGQHWLAASQSIKWDKTNEYWDINTVLTDITQRKQAEMAVQEEKEKLSLFIKYAPVSVAMFDRQMFYIEVSQKWLDLYQLGSREDVMGRSHYEVLPNLSEAWKQIHQECLAGATRKCEQDSFIFPDGSEQILKWEVLPWIQMTGEVGGILMFVEDITETKRLEEQFYHAQRLESLGTLASGIAHDFNNILTPILGITQLLPLKIPNLDESVANLLAILSNSARRGAELVKQILLFSRNTEGEYAILSLHSLLLELIGIMKQTFPKSIEIITDISTQTLWNISADATQIHQVFMNLMINARDAMPDGGALTICAENLRLEDDDVPISLAAKAGEYVVVKVTDTGIGIPAELLTRIFDPFFTTKEVGKGTGLGLSTVMGIVKHHGGFVTVESEVGKGAEFKVVLPAIAGEVSTPSIEASSPRGNGELILIVDDELEIREVIKAALESHNYRTILASDGIGAIALYGKYQQEVSAVIMDIMMPNLDGMTTIHTLQNLNPLVKVIAISGLIDNRKLALEAKATTFLLKPFSIEQLLQTLAKILSPNQFKQVDQNQSDRLLSTERNPPPITKLEVFKEAIAVMPPEWLQQMHEAAYYCDDEVMLELINQMPPSQQAIAQALKGLVLDFKTDIIIELTQRESSLLNHVS
ncbi:PAS domain S-box protein [Pseudanabaena mucicola]|uniref:histidine kinase n=1 Tax=Pseudanabaena mucicola FACHB-723 TaxID=2692860 RepID=A0ABR7ZS24_9CYAN|nr:PAS domain S-box protein [Pseudanabaena mucicola]MBD2186746.1 PAS domain S-box protein [Pseudanabaena mucicola FACHB-723]